MASVTEGLHFKCLNIKFQLHGHTWPVTTVLDDMDLEAGQNLGHSDQYCDPLSVYLHISAVLSRAQGYGSRSWRNIVVVG